MTSDCVGKSRVKASDSNLRLYAETVIVPMVAVESSSPWKAPPVKMFSASFMDRRDLRQKGPK